MNGKSRWTQEVLQQVVNENGERTYTAHVDPSTDGTYVAYFIDVKYDNQLKSLTGKEIPKDLPRRWSLPLRFRCFPTPTHMRIVKERDVRGRWFDC